MARSCTLGGAAAAEASKMLPAMTAAVQARAIAAVVGVAVILPLRGVVVVSAVRCCCGAVCSVSAGVCLCPSLSSGELGGVSWAGAYSCTAGRGSGSST